MRGHSGLERFPPRVRVAELADDRLAARQGLANRFSAFLVEVGARDPRVERPLLHLERLNACREVLELALLLERQLLMPG